MGFEPTRGNPIGLAGRRLSCSAKVSSGKGQGLKYVCKAGVPAVQSPHRGAHTQDGAHWGGSSVDREGVLMRSFWVCAAEATPVGFEPTRGNPIGVAGPRLNRSANVSLIGCRYRLISNMQRVTNRNTSVLGLRCVGTRFVLNCRAKYLSEGVQAWYDQTEVKSAWTTCDFAQQFRHRDSNPGRPGESRVS